MKRLLLPLLAALALPTAVNAESYWLIMRFGGSGLALEKIQMKSMSQCEEQGQRFIKSGVAYSDYFCVVGK